MPHSVAVPPDGSRRYLYAMNRLSVLWRSVAITLLCRVRGMRGAYVILEGQFPVLHTRGTIRVRKIALRSRTVRVEIGADEGAVLEIGDGTFINQGAVIVASSRITIGANCRVGDQVAIYDSDFHAIDESTPTRTAPVTIGFNVWLGRGATVLPGVCIGDHAVVAAGAVVTKDVVSRTLVAGNPAKRVRELSASSDWRRV